MGYPELTKNLAVGFVSPPMLSMSSISPYDDRHEPTRPWSAGCPPGVVGVLPGLLPLVLAVIWLSMLGDAMELLFLFPLFPCPLGC